jgi:predicted transcriptional regulator
MSKVQTDFTQIPNKIINLMLSKEIDTQDFAILTIIQKYVNNDGCLATVSFFAEAINMHRRHVSKRIDNLLSKGIITREARKDKKFVYNINLDFVEFKEKVSENTDLFVADKKEEAAKPVIAKKPELKVVPQVRAEEGDVDLNNPDFTHIADNLQYAINNLELDTNEKAVVESALANKLYKKIQSRVVGSIYVRAEKAKQSKAEM